MSKPIPPQIKHWVFDLDGTLVDSFEHYFSTLRDIFVQHGQTFSPDLHKTALTEPLDSFFGRHLGQSSIRPAFDRLHLQSNEDAKQIRPFPGIEDLLRELAGRGSRLAVWTNRDLVSAKLILEHSGLARWFEACVSGSCVVRRKPEPEGLERIITGYGCAPGSVAMVGDHEHDVTAARSIGAHAVRASWHSYWDEGPCSLAHHQFGSTHEFASWALGHPRAPSID